jgi:hypothetical protein
MRRQMRLDLRYETTKNNQGKNFVLSAIAPALLYLLHPCSRLCSS